MEARPYGPARMAVRTIVFLAWAAAIAPSLSAASFATRNFAVHAPTRDLARQLGEAAEEYRRTLAVDWLGYELPPWNEKCPIHARILPGAGGVTSFLFTGGRVHGWQMEIQGSPERMLDSVLPHEVTHTVFATHFGRPLPRWADEGACTTVENPGEVARMERELIRFLKTRRGIRFSDMMWMKEYPRDLMPLYAQGHSVADFLIGLQGKRTFIAFLEDGLGDDNWPRAVKKHYGYTNLTQMQDEWLTWVRTGRPRLESGEGAPTRLVADTKPASVDPSAGETDPVPIAAQPPTPSTSLTLVSHEAPARDARQHSSEERIVFQWRAEESHR